MILVTGATGFVGKYLVKELVKQGHDFKCFVRKGNDKYSLNAENVVYGDITDQVSVENALEGVDLVVHLAAATGSSNQDLYYPVNVLGSQNIISACKKKKVSRVIVVSTCAVARKEKGPYAESKHKSEERFLSSGLKITILRPTLIYGRESKGLKGIIKFVKMFPLIIPVIGSGLAKNRPVYVGDVTQAIINCIDRQDKVAGKIYDLGGKTVLTFNEMLDVISKQLNVKKMKIHVPYFLCYVMARLLGIFMKRPFITIDQLLGIKHGNYVDISDSEKEIDYNPVGFEKGTRLSLGG